MTRLFDKAFRWVAVGLLTIFAKLKFRLKARVIDVPEDGSLILGNHTCIWDFAFLISALWPRSNERFVATSVQYDKSRLTRWAFRHLGIIRKQQGTEDLQSVREMMRASKEGGMVVIYPAGLCCFDGQDARSAMPGAGTLPRLLRCGVYVAVVNGGFLSAPRYTPGQYRGRVEITVKRLLSKEEAAALTPEEIQARINEALRFNDWDWQKAHPVAFKHIGDMKGVWRELYRCPSCGAEGAMEQGKKELRCAGCGLRVTRDQYGFFESDSGACPSRMDEWADRELEALRREIAAGDFSITSDSVTLWESEEGARQAARVDAGTLMLSAEGIVFQGQNGARRDFPMGSFQFLISDDVDTLRINRGKGSSLFRFEDPRLLNKWVFAHMILTGEK